ncbi:hypothetical protein QQ045_007495 [Rhodiola kirilowii]
MMKLGNVYVFILTFGFLGLMLPAGTDAWSKEGHIMTCQIAQSLLEPEAAEIVAKLLPDYANGDLSSLCTWPDQIRHWYKYRWTSPLHFIDTPDKACTFKYDRDCHDPHGNKDMCPMHIGFTTDRGGNTIDLRWFRHKSNLHHVWDREIILTAAADFYGKDIDSLLEDIKANLTSGIWSEEISSWKDCKDIKSCTIKYATESINMACKWGYKGVTSGETLADEYFNPRMPLVMQRVAQGGVRLAMILNSVFGGSESHEELARPT